MFRNEWSSPERNNVEIAELVGLQPAPAHVSEEYVEVPKCPVGILYQVLPKEPAEGRLKLHDKVRRLPIGVDSNARQTYGSVILGWRRRV